MSTSTLLLSSSHPQRLGLRRSLGFTLIELLTVVAIIGVLAAILFPVLGRVRETAKDSRCVENLHQIGLAIQTYAADNKGALPATGFFGVAPYYNRDQRNFQNSLLPYLNLPAASGWSTSVLTDMVHADVFDCPGYKGVTNGKCYLLQQTVTADNGTTIKPWGTITNATGSVSPKPQKIIAIPNGAWAMRDNDTSTTDMNHSGYQNTLYFDWHVGRVAVAN